MENKFLKNEDAVAKLLDVEISLNEVVELLGYMLEDYYKGTDILTKASNYDRIETYLALIHELLFLKHEELEKIIN